MDDWYFEKLNDLKIRERRLTTLSEIHVRLNAAESQRNIREITNRLLSSPEIFECLEDASESSETTQQFEVASDILSICMANVSINDTNFNRTALHRALEHQRPGIRALALSAVLKELQRHANPTDFKLPQDTLLLVVNCLQHEDTQVGGPAIPILTLLLVDKLELEIVKQALLNMLSQNETVKCRVYEVAVILAKHSAGTLAKVEFLLDRAIAELTSNDILLQVNIMEILVQLAEQNHGLLYLERRQVFEAFSARVAQLEQNPIDRLLVPGIMKFFGKTACLQPQKIITGYPHMINCLFECLLSGDVNVLPVSFDTFANLALTSQGKLLLESNYGTTLPEIFQEIASYLRNLSSDLKNRAFGSLELIFSGDSPHTQEVSNVLRKWFTYLAENSNNMQFLMDFCRNPFPDIKVACLAFIKAVCIHSWGIEALKNTAGFIEYLLDRKIEFDKDAKFAKFELIQLLADSSMFELQTQLQLTTYVNEGPYFVQSIMDVAVEGNS